jgi:hypothetical protein
VTIIEDAEDELTMNLLGCLRGLMAHGIVLG